MQIAVIFVHYHGAAWLVRALEALRQDLCASGLPEAEFLIVDNGSTAAERAVLQQLPARYLSAGSNRGYAGGINLGVAATHAELLLLMNPDVEVLPGCLSALLGALQNGAAAVGPVFYWDSACRFLLPPTELRTRRDEALRVMASAGEGWAGLARRRWRRHAQRHWQTATNLPTSSLSGALLAVRRDAWLRVGAFDEGFQLYFEENDWLVRLRRCGLQSYLVPTASAVHFYNQSAAHEPSASRWFAESAALYERRYYGAAFVALKRWGMTRLAAVSSSLGVAAEDLPDTLDWSHWPDPPAWVELSPSPLGFPAAAERLALHQTVWSFPAELGDYLAAGQYWITLVSEDRKELARYRFDWRLD